MSEWNPHNYRMFVGNLGPEVTQNYLLIAFKKYKSLKKVKVIPKRGYGFASFSDAAEFIRACKEMDGKFIGRKPIVIKKSN